jgi:hypothetical protein
MDEMKNNAIVKIMGKIKTQIRQKITDQQRIAFAKQIETLYEASHANTKNVLAFSLLKGIATGLGVFLGGTLIVALLLWLLSLGNNIPFVGKISQGAKNSIEQTDKTNEQ